MRRVSTPDSALPGRPALAVIITALLERLLVWAVHRASGTPPSERRHPRPTN
ncbi:hypothetical protein NMK54_21955 [Nocardia otitidiscaviarum]|uniref:hypothetical protein n=1 Tax=Nocardia otitidiscaviarum TaxID=1823 RepID=UPI00163D750B|nr:hypothetical protein [Nocardia otitidiscaviarum]MCP9622816.1 hypothetical protein [Nocardia otitidiscaviarum]